MATGGRGTMFLGRACQLLLVVAAAARAPLAAGHLPDVEYTNHFAVVVPGGRDRAERAAGRHGCSLVDSIGELTDHYLLECHSVQKRSTEQSHHHISLLHSSGDIVWADQQYYRRRTKRDDAKPAPARPERWSLPLRPDTSGVREHSGTGGRFRRRSALPYWPDPLFREQWYLDGGARDGSDMNVIPAWQQGYTGKGVVVSILDDGIQPDHPDLSANYDGRASLDINDNDDDPTPRDNGANRHGTRCAGEVAAVAGNAVCGVGVAPNASIGGVRMLDGGVNDYVEAKALSYQRNYIDIYSASWGPEDDGKTVDGPGPLARRAFIEGVLKGRRGKGSIFVWASGNGGQYVDNCNCDGYTNSIFTLSISSASQGGNKPWYLEECASTLATTYSSGTPMKDKSIATCDQDAALRPKHICTVSHTGTSASAPLAAGLCALALEANPMLTWRDMQYIVLMTSRYEPLAKELGWLTNGVGRRVSHKFGYGLMDAGAMIDLAKRWMSVPFQHICITPIDSRSRAIPTGHGQQLRVSMEVTACQGTVQAVNFLEHVQCKVTLAYMPRGNLRILLTSPSGTVSTLLFERPLDVTGSSFDRWPFMSVHFWGENPHGVWNLTIFKTDTRAAKTEGVLKEWQLILYGTEEEPIRLRPAAGPQFGPGSVPHSSVVSRSDASSPGLYCSRQCVHSCQSQPAGDTCKRCQEQYKSECQRSCDPGTYYSGETGCQPCHTSCSTCFGRLSNQCLDCAADHFLINDLSVCLAACPDGYFTVNQTCESCGPHCTSCAGSSNRCLSCASHLILYKEQCVATCPAGTYEVNRRCEPCASGCETCVGPSDTNCVLCRPGLSHADGRCVAVCPPGTYRAAERAECLRCRLGCRLCSSPLVCQRCSPGWREASDGGCLVINSDRCPDGEFYSGATCRRCHPTCRTCSGAMSVECTLCQPDTFLHNGLCYRDCPEGFSPVDGVCHPCLHTCQDCRAPHECSSCRPGLLMHNTSCVAACPPRTYRAQDECLPCADSCFTCFGRRGDQCLSCHTGLYLADGSCLASCPDGHFRTVDGCRRCHRTCLTCTGGTVTECSSCREGYELLVGEGTCSACAGRQYFSHASQLCQTCHETCGTCIGAGPSNCSSCAGELRLQLPQHRCLPCCERHLAQPQPSSCCPCDPSHEHCVRGTRRRTVDSRYPSPPPAVSAFSWFYVQAAVWCASSVFVFAVIFAALQCRSKTGRRTIPVLELTESDERLALTDYQNDDHMDDLSDGNEDHLVVFNSGI